MQRRTFIAAATVVFAIAAATVGFFYWHSKSQAELQNLAKSLLLAGNRALDRGDDRAAETNFKQLLAIDSLFAERDALRGQALFSLGMVERTSIGPAAAERRYREALPLLEWSDLKAFIQCEVILAGVLLDRERSKEAALIMDHARGALKDVDWDVRQYFELSVIIASHLVRLHRAEEAAPLLEHAQQYYLTHEPGSEHLASSEYWLGQAAYERKEYEDAKQRLEKAIALWEKSPDRHRVRLGDAYHGLGLSYFMTKDFPEAESLLLHAIELRKRVRRLSDAAAAAHLDLGRAQYWLRKPAEAAYHVRQAREAYRTLYGPRNLKIGESEVMLATLYRDCGRLEQAVSAYREALEVYGARPDQSEMVVKINSWIAELEAQQTHPG